ESAQPRPPIAVLRNLTEERPDLSPRHRQHIAVHGLDGAPGLDIAHSPTAPSIRSRSRSAWPLCLAYSSIMWTKIQRRETGRRVEAARVSRSSTAPATAR